MQLKKRAQIKTISNISGALTAATCSLLGGQALAAEEDSSFLDGWKFDTALLYYSESDRVSALEGIFNASKEYDVDNVLNFKLTFDALTGASANGALVQQDVQTFSRPSGKGQFDVAAGDTPLDDTFHDTRVQVNVNYGQPFAENWVYSTGLHFSKEYDYLSLGLSGGLSRYFNDKNTTVSTALSLSSDTIDPEGGRPIGLSSMVIDEGQYASEDEYWAAFDATRQEGDADKDTMDVLLGVTQVINRRTLMNFNYSYSNVDGYLTDPFKIVSSVDVNGVAQDYLYENRPDSRTKHSVYWQTKYHAEHGVYDISYRYMSDDWKIKSHTFELRSQYDIGDASYIQPHLRFYSQNAAEFYKPYRFENDIMPTYLSADYRIGEMKAVTIGAKYGWKLDSGNEMAIRLEYYRQDISDAGFDNFGMNITPSVDAIILQFNYSF